MIPIPEFIMYKRLLNAIKNISILTGTEVNKMIFDACEAGYRDLDIHDKMIVAANIQALRDHAKKRGVNLGEGSALELMASAIWYKESEER